MIKPRYLPATDYLALKAAFRELVRSAGGPHAAAGITRVSAALLSRYGAAHEEVFAPDDVVADLEAEVGDPMVTRVRADLAGFVLVAKSAIEKPVETIDQASAPVMKEVGEVLAQLGEGLRDGVCTPREAEQLLEPIREATAEIHELNEAVKARAGRGA